MQATEKEKIKVKEFMKKWQKDIKPSNIELF